MKKSDLIKTIKEDSDNVEVNKLRPETLHTIHNTVVEKVDSFKRRPTISLKLSFSICILVLIIVFTGLLINKNTRPIDDVSYTKRIYGLQATTLFNFASIYDQGLNLNLDESEYNDISQKLDDYMMLIDEISSKDRIEYKLEVLSNNAYMYKLEIITSLNGEEKNYTMYYNEISDALEYDDIDEVSSMIVGYVVSDNVDYQLKGKKEVSSDETEVELKMYLSDNAYIEVSQEIEKNENEYEYKYIKDGVEIKSIELSTENKMLYDEVELEIVEVDDEISLEVKYYNDKMIIEFEMKDYEGSAVVVFSGEKYVFDFKELKQKNKKII